VSAGRADLPGGNLATLLRSIREVLFTVPDDTVVWSGHGEPTTIGHERRHEPLSANFVMWGFGDLVI
jgi:hydroxyacylglutathione hydrolase